MKLTTAQGNTFETYPSGNASAARAVLLIHDWWGVQDYNLEWAGRFAKRGYYAMVADLYAGKTTDDAKVAGALMQAVDQSKADDKLAAAVAHLAQGGRPTAVLGWSFGGRQALLTACANPDQVRACAMFYSRIITDPAMLRRLGGPVLAVFAERERDWPDKMVDFERAMTRAGKDLRPVSFDAAHGFANPAGSRYDEDAADDAWDATCVFFDEVIPRK